MLPFANVHSLCSLNSKLRCPYWARESSFGPHRSISVWPTPTDLSCAEDKCGRTGNMDWIGKHEYQQTKICFPSDTLQLSSYFGCFYCKRKIILPSEKDGISIININRSYRQLGRKDLLKEVQNIINMIYVHFLYFKLPTYFYLSSVPIGHNWKELQIFPSLIQDPKELQDCQELIRKFTADIECELKQLCKTHSTC